MSKFVHIALLLACLGMPLTVGHAQAPAKVYYVSPAGSDTNPGTDPDHPLKTINKVNGLALNPGDQVLFACGETWRAEMLMITRSGSAGNPITYSSYPAGCANQPRLDGTQPITGWSVHSGNIYAASVSAARFPNGLNQLFRDGQRLRMGRWPNINAGDGGYSTVDGQPAGNRITDNQLPAGNWVGATIHLKVIRWSMINRDVTGRSGNTITLNSSAGCWNGSCTGWGYFINNSLNTLDQEGEWYYDKAARRVYLYTTTSPTSSLIEGSVVLKTDDRNWGAVVLGSDSAAPVQHVVIDNFDIRGWFRSGIVSPTNLHPDENSYLTLRNNTIRDVDDSGISLWSWVWGASDSLDGWRGGNNILIQNNLIDGANSFGIHTPSRVTTIEHNTIRNIGLASNLNEAGMGCGKTGSEGSCTENGAGLRIYVDRANRSGYGFTVQYNRFENIGYNGIQTFGGSSTFSTNVFDHTCVTKGDGGAINTFGGGDLATTSAHDIQILNNLILHTIGNTDGTAASFREPFGFGIYLDNGSRNITTRGNTVAYSSATGILYQNSTGLIENNTVFRNVTGGLWANQVDLGGSPSAVTSFSGNTMVSGGNRTWNLSLASTGQTGAADNNRYYHSAQPSMQVNLNGQSLSLAQWQSTSGKDAHASTGNQNFSAKLLLYVNDTSADKTFSIDGWHFADLDGGTIGQSFVLEPYSSRVVALAGDPGNHVYLPLVRR